MFVQLLASQRLRLTSLLLELLWAFDFWAWARHPLTPCRLDRGVAWRGGRHCVHRLVYSGTCPGTCPDLFLFCTWQLRIDHRGQGTIRAHGPILYYILCSSIFFPGARVRMLARTDPALACGHPPIHRIYMATLASSLLAVEVSHRTAQSTLGYPHKLQKEMRAFTSCPRVPPSLLTSSRDPIFLTVLGNHSLTTSSSSSFCSRFAPVVPQH